MQNKLNKVWGKILASILVIALTAGNLMLIGSSMVAFAGENLEAQNEKTQHANVEFGAYFISEEQKVHSLVRDAKAEEKLFIHLNVKEAGYLKTGKIEIVGANYEITGQLENSEIIGSKEGNSFTLKQIEYGTEATLEVPIKLVVEDMFNVTNIQKDSKVILTGTYVTPNGEEVEINKDVTLNLAWEEQTEIAVKSEIKTYKTYKSEDESGIIIQEKIEVEKTKGILPVNKTKIVIDAKQYVGEFPTNVSVRSVKSEMTNGKANENVNYNYNKETGKIEIEVINEPIDGVVYSKQGGKDEYIVTYEYSEKAYEAKQEEISMETKIDVIVENYTATAAKKEAKANYSETKTLTNEFGNLVNVEVSITEEINKAKIYANYNSNRREYETEFTVKEVVNVVKPSLVNEILIESNPESFIDKDGNKHSARIEDVDYTYFKSTKIEETNFKELLGENGSLIVTNEEGEEIGRIDSTVEAKDGIFEIKYAEKEGKIIITTSRPMAEGNLVLEHDKAIKADLAYSKEAALSFIKICANTSIGTEDEIQEVNGEQNLVEAVSNLKVESNKESINNKEENIELRVELGNNSENSILYSNPTVKVTLPEFVESVEVVNSNLLFESELTLGKTQVISGDNGEKIIEVKLNGTQTKFSNMVNGNGSTLVLGANIVSSDAGTEPIVVDVNGNTASTEITSYIENSEEVKSPILGNDLEENNEEEIPEETEEEEPRISIFMDSGMANLIIKEEEKITYNITVNNIDDKDVTPIENLVIKDFLPSGVVYENATMEIYNIESGVFEEKADLISYDAKNRVVTWDVGSITYSQDIKITLTVKLNALTEDINEKEITNNVIASYEGMTGITSNSVKITVSKAGLSITKLTENVGATNKPDDIIKLIINVQNVGKIKSDKFETEIIMPVELEPIEVIYTKNGVIDIMSQQENNIKIDAIELEGEESYFVEILARIKDLSQDYSEQFKEITPTAIVNGEQISWTIKVENSNYNIQEPDEPDIPNTPGTPDMPDMPNTPETPDNPNPSITTKTYSINGTAWLDENKNGVKEEGELLLPNIEVEVVDANNKSLNKTKTDVNGNYSFEKIQSGEYQVIFYFDGNVYNVTEYRKTGNAEINSSAVESAVGQALTDVIAVSSKDIQHINIGLTKIPEFNMSLKKEVSKIIVQNEEGTKTYEYGSDYAKLDINGKYLKDTVVLVEYKITIKNEGELAGRVKKIIDYMPRDMSFSTDLNRTWVQDSDGNLYNSELKSLDIEPGETKEISLILRKKMTEENTGIICNTAELAEVENSEKIKDKNSTPNNRVEGEDDMSSANLLIGVKTGEEVMYITLGIVIMIIFATGVYLINRKVLN